jgi:hypothetical protein
LKTREKAGRKRNNQESRFEYEEKVFTGIQAGDDQVGNRIGNGSTEGCTRYWSSRKHYLQMDPIPEEPFVVSGLQHSEDAELRKAKSE